MAVKDLSKAYLWAARILAIAFALFTALFSLDVFGSGEGFFEELLAFLIHSAPSIAMLLLVLLFWKRSDISAYGFFTMAVLFTLLFKTYRDLLLFAMLSLPLALIGLIFLGAHLSNRGKAQQ